MQAYAAGQVDVGPWLGIVEAASTEPRQSDRQWSQLPLRHPDAGQFHPLPAIHPDPTVTVDEDIGHGRVGEGGRQVTEAEQVTRESGALEVDAVSTQAEGGGADDVADDLGAG